MGEPPMILGWEVAGTVEEAGDSVFRFAPGDRVFGMPWFPHPARCHAEYVTAPFRHIAHTPEAFTDEQAGALPLAGLTAWQALVEVARVGRATGFSSTRLPEASDTSRARLRRRTARTLIGTRDDNHDLRELGVDEPIDYTAGPFEEAVSDVDVVLDLVGEDDPSLIRSVEVLRKGGVLVAIAGELTKNVIKMAGKQSKRATEILVAPDDAGLESLAALADEGKLTVHVERTFPLEHASEAHELLREEPRAWEARPHELASRSSTLEGTEATEVTSCETPLTHGPARKAFAADGGIASHGSRPPPRRVMCRRRRTSSGWQGRYPNAQIPDRDDRRPGRCRCHFEHRVGGGHQLEHRLAMDASEARQQKARTGEGLHRNQRSARGHLVRPAGVYDG